MEAYANQFLESILHAGALISSLKSVVPHADHALGSSLWPGHLPLVAEVCECSIHSIAQSLAN